MFLGTCGGFICVWVPAFAPVCLHPYVFIREGRPAGTVVVGEGEEPPDGQLWQRGQLWSKAQEEEEERGESSRLSRREKRWSRAAEWETQDDGVFKPMVGPTNKQEKHLLLCYHHTESDSLEYIPLAILKYCKYLWTLAQENGAKWPLISFLSDLISFRNIWSTTERMPTLNQFLHYISSSDEGCMQVFQIIESCIYSIGSGQRIDCRQIELRWESGGSLTKGDNLTQGHVCKKPCGQTNVFWRNSCGLGHSGFAFSLREAI